MRVLVYSAQPYEKSFLQNAAQNHELTFTGSQLNIESVSIAEGFQAITIFTSDDASSHVLDALKEIGVQQIALRSVGYDHVDLTRAKELNIRIANVPEYSPYAVAEHATAILLAANRKLAQSRLLMQLHDYRLDNLTGFDIHGKTVGIVGTGKIGMAFARIMHGFGATVIACDPQYNSDALNMGISYTSFNELLQQCDIISIHCPLNKITKHLFSNDAFHIIKPGCILVNTARGAIIDTEALITALEDGKVAAACLDTYENEKPIFFKDRRGSVIKDSLFIKLNAFENVFITGHQGFLTIEALTEIARITTENIDHWQRGERSPNELT